MVRHAHYIVDTRAPISTVVLSYLLWYLKGHVPGILLPGHSLKRVDNNSGTH